MNTSFGFGVACGWLCLAGFLFPVGAVNIKTPPMTNPTAGITYAGGPTRYVFDGWPKGAETPVRFTSAIYRPGRFSTDSASFVRLDDENFLIKSDSLIRHPWDFDSLKALEIVYASNPSQSAGQGRAAVPATRPRADSVWHVATVIGGHWGFPRVLGAMSLYGATPVGRVRTYGAFARADDTSSASGTLRPGPEDYNFMDLGEGPVKYSLPAIRERLAQHPRSAEYLKAQRTGFLVQTGLIVGGLGMVIGGVPLSIKTMEDENGDEYQGFSPSPLIFLGAATAFASWIPYLMTRDHVAKAIGAYNEDLTRRDELGPSVDGTLEPKADGSP